MTSDYFCNAHIYVQIWVIIGTTSVLAGTESQSQESGQRKQTATAEPNIFTAVMHWSYCPGSKISVPILQGYLKLVAKNLARAVRS